MLLRDIFGRIRAQPEEREIGMEIELEGCNLPVAENFNNYWRVAGDGSLRGENAEYVNTRPVARDRVGSALLYLYKRLEHSEIVDSGRAGIHVHINCQYMTVTQVYNFICLYLLFEDMLVDYCGESRKGNHHCLRVKDAEYLIEYLRGIIVNRDWESFHSNAIRYASINVAALHKFGSLEFRAMRSPVEQEVIETWVGILLNLKDYAIKTVNPPELLNQFSYNGVEKLLEDVFGDNLRHLNNTEQQRQNILEAMWRVQDIAYAEVDWEQLNKKEQQANWGATISTDAGVINDTRFINVGGRGVAVPAEMAAEMAQEPPRPRRRRGFAIPHPRLGEEDI